MLLEGKGDADEKDYAKATAARRWVEAVNTWGGLGQRTTKSATTQITSQNVSHRTRKPEERLT